MSIFNWPVVKELVPHSVQQNKISTYTHLYIFALFNTPITTIWIYGIKKLDILSISSVLLVSELIIIALVLCTSGTVTVCWKLLWNEIWGFLGIFNGQSRPHTYIKLAILLYILKLEGLNLLIINLTLELYKSKRSLWMY